MLLLQTWMHYPAQLAAIAEWGKKRPGSFDYLNKITHPVLVVTGKKDIIFPTVNSYLLQQHLPEIGTSATMITHR